MDPLSRRVGSRSASDLAGLIVAAEADSCYSTDACSFSLFSAAVIGTPETPAQTATTTTTTTAASAAATAGDASAVNAAVDLSGGSTSSSDEETSPTPPRLRHPASVADSLYCRSEPGTSEFSVGGDEDNTTLLAECLRRVLQIDGLDGGAAAVAAATAAVPDCCVYANCNCGQATMQPPPPPPPPTTSSPTAKGVGDKQICSSSGCKMTTRRGGVAVGGCRCCCIS